MSLSGNPKISIIGAGNVGATLGMRVAEAGLGDVVLVDIVEGMPQGKALDLSEARPVSGRDCKIIGTNNYADIAGSDVVVTTSGIPRKPGMSRDDLIETNGKIARSVGENLARYAPEAIIVQVANPLDAITYVIAEVTKAPANRIMGMAGVLDSARYRYFIAEALGVSVVDVQGFVLGGHGDTMVPVPSLTTVGGVSLPHLLAGDKIEAIVDRTRNGGAEIVGLLKTGSAYYAPASAAVEMAESIIKDKKKILPCAVFLQGEYGLKDLFIGVPVKLGAGGVEEIIEITLTAEEKSALQNSAAAVQELKDVLKKLNY